MGFTFTAFSYICALVLDAFLIFFSIFHVIQSFCYVDIRRIDIDGPAILQLEKTLAFKANVVDPGIKIHYSSAPITLSSNLSYFAWLFSDQILHSSGLSPSCTVANAETWGKFYIF